MVEIQLYKYNGLSNVVNKTLTDAVTMTGLLRETYNTYEPVITVRTDDVFVYNYCFLPVFGKYYFVESVNVVDKNTYSVSLTEDVIMTYKEQILSSTGIVTESDEPNRYASNRNNVYDVRPQFQTLIFPNKELFSEDGSIIMVTIKGDK